MAAKYLKSIVDFANGIGADVFFFSSVGVVFGLFIVNLLLSLFRINYSVKKRRWYIFSVLITVCIEAAFFSVLNDEYFSTLYNGWLFYPLMSLALGIILCLCTNCIREKKTTYSKAKKFVEMIDGELEKQGLIKNETRQANEMQNNTSKIPFQPNFTNTALDKKLTAQKVKVVIDENEDFPVKVIDNGAPYTENAVKTEKSELDFGHVKSIISKLSYQNLSVNDRKQVNELSLLIIEAEKDGLLLGYKSKINDGLSNLLKIMSKYSV